MKTCLMKCAENVWSELKHRFDFLRANNGEYIQRKLWNHVLRNLVVWCLFIKFNYCIFNNKKVYTSLLVLFKILETDWIHTICMYVHSHLIIIHLSVVVSYPDITSLSIMYLLIKTGQIIKENILIFWGLQTNFSRPC